MIAIDSKYRKVENQEAEGELCDSPREANDSQWIPRIETMKANKSAWKIERMKAANPIEDEIGGKRRDGDDAWRSDAWWKQEV